MLVDIVRTTTRDGVRLDGAFQAPAAAVSAGITLDALCLVHGTGSNFYGSALLESVADHFLGRGCAVLRVNTRGHDGISTAQTDRGGRRQGAAYEVLDECRHDLAAWLDWLGQRAGPRLGLVGHSLGAVKCLYALAHEPHPGVRGLLALSPPRLSYAWFCASPDGPTFLEDYALAERHLREGRPGALLDVRFPLPMVIAAGGYLDKYGPEERYNYLRLLPGLRCPTLLTLGSREAEQHTPFRGVPEALADLGRRRGPVTLEVIAGGDHVYTGVRSDLLGRVEGWLRATLP